MIWCPVIWEIGGWEGIYQLIMAHWTPAVEVITESSYQNRTSSISWLLWILCNQIVQMASYNSRIILDRSGVVSNIFYVHISWNFMWVLSVAPCYKLKMTVNQKEVINSKRCFANNYYILWLLSPEFPEIIKNPNIIFKIKRNHYHGKSRRSHTIKGRHNKITCSNYPGSCS